VQLDAQLVQLDLFDEVRLQSERLEAAIEAQDFERALPDAPSEWVPALREIVRLLHKEGLSPRLAVKLLRIQDPSWTERMERAWRLLVGRCLDASQPPAELQGEIAASWLLRGGREDLAKRSLERHLEARPAEPRIWSVAARFQAFPAQVRCYFHGGEPGDDLDEILDLIDQDQLPSPRRWSLVYAFIAGRIDRQDIEDALSAEDLLLQGPVPLPESAEAFAWYLLAEDGARRGRLPGSPSPVEARRTLQRISPRTFQRFMGTLS
jgi:hypothetical protein